MITNMLIHNMLFSRNNILIINMLVSWVIREINMLVSWVIREINIQEWNWIILSACHIINVLLE
jgi:hypothetical protein